MKNNKKSILLASLLGLTIVSTNLNMVDAQITNLDQGHVCGDEHPIQQQKCHRKGLLKESIEQLEQQGVLNQEDVKNIKAYNQQQRANKEKDRAIEKVDKMVQDKVITKEKGDKLKEAITNNKVN